jgi:chemotaxis protein MotB
MKIIQQVQKVDAGAPKWVVTFGDLMSLLLCFFVLLLSFSNMDRQKYKQVAGSMERAFGVQRKEKVMEMPMGQSMVAKDFDQTLITTRINEEFGRQLEEMIEKNLPELKEQISIERGDREITIRLMGESTFASGKAEIRPELKPLLQKVAELIHTSSGDIVVSGHTDNVPLSSGPFGSNLRLSIGRAVAVAEFLIDRRVDPRRVATMGFGEYRPIVSNITAAGRQKNRRVEIVITNIHQEITTPKAPP